MSLPKVNIFNYTAAANPYFVKSLAHKYGYEFDKDQQLETVLQQLVTYEGEPVMMEIIENNPDKDLFMDYFEKKYGKKEEKNNSNELGGARLLDTYMNFTGQLQAAQQTAENIQSIIQMNASFSKNNKIDGWVFRRVDYGMSIGHERDHLNFEKNNIVTEKILEIARKNRKFQVAL